MDELLDRGVSQFLLDGQAILLDDYLAVRPERKGELARALGDGRLEAGPWYVLADELIPSGESLVRNLLAGRRALRRLGAVAPPVLYSPDAFGHPAALPAIARGFGYRLAIVWRGYGGPHWPAGDTARWHWDGGDAVTLYHLSPAGYELGSNLPVDAGAAADRWRKVCAALQPRAATGVALLPNGADHHGPQASPERALDLLRQAARPHEVRRGSLRDFADELLARAERMALPTVRGELRDSYGYTWTLAGTPGTRAAQKRAAARVERRLLREAEPWCALARWRDDGEPRALLDAAWSTLLRCHPHDTLCGCSTDAVALAMDARLASAAAQAAGLRADALMQRIGHDAAEARTRKPDWRPVLLLRNAAARPRGGVAEVVVLRMLADEPVGPGSAPVDVPEPSRTPPPLGGMPSQLLRARMRRDRVESPYHYPDNDLVEAQRLVVWTPPVSGYGTLAVELDDPAPPGPTGPTHPVRASGLTLDNGLLRVEVSARGAIRLTAPALGIDISDLLTFEDVGDVGDLYTHSPIGQPVAPPRFLGARLVHDGPLRGEIHLRWRLALPRAWMPRVGPASRALARARGRATVRLHARLTLDADAPWLRVRVSGHNAARDHRLRACLASSLASSLAGALVRADAAFAPVWREPIVVDPGDLAMESPPPTAPLHRYVSRFAADRGVTVFSDGLAEYEATNTGGVAVTLVRAVGQLSRNDLPERPGHAGWPADTPAAQCLGPFQATFAVLPHAGPTTGTFDLIERTADDVLLPLAGSTVRAALAVPPPTLGVELEGRGLAFSCCRPAEVNGWTLVRCVNRTDEPARGQWRFGAALREAQLARMDETPLEALTVDGATVSFEAPAHAIVSILVR